VAKFDPRITPFREDFAAAHLKDKIDVKSYGAGATYHVCAPIAPVFRQPSPSSMMDTQLVFGTNFQVYDVKGRWAWGQEIPFSGRFKGYVGYVPKSALREGGLSPTHRISELRAPVFTKADIKSRIRKILPLNALITIEEKGGDFSKAADLGIIHNNHLIPAKQKRDDFTHFAECHLGLPYIWGGLGPDGLDCSGLVLSALRAIGKQAPRDTDMQEKALGKPIEITKTLSGLKRGDLIFWKGHVGIMCNAKTLLHANAHHMKVEKEALKQAVKRIANKGYPVTSIKRIP
jgi:cell wall-associated NlpC family hydrolase